MKSAMEHKHLDVQFILDALAGSVPFFFTEGDLLHEDGH